MAMAIQTFGWVRAETVALTVVKLIGVILVIICVLVAVVLSARLENKNGLMQSGFAFWHVWGILTGMFASFQQAITGHLVYFFADYDELVGEFEITDKYKTLFNAMWREHLAKKVDMSGKFFPLVTKSR